MAAVIKARDMQWKDHVSAVYSGTNTNQDGIKQLMKERPDQQKSNTESTQDWSKLSAVLGKMK